MIPQAFIHDLLARADIAEVVAPDVELKRAGVNFKALCPFHSERSPSFVVSPSRQTYHCFGCGVHGNALTFLMEHRGLEFPDAVRELASIVGMPMPAGNDTPPAKRESISPRQALRLLDREVTLVAVAASNVGNGVSLTDEDRQRVLKAAGTIGGVAREFCHG
jgi:DNA primase